MKKSIITLAVLGAAVALPMSASADMKVYAHAQVEIASYDIDGAAPGGDGISVEDNARGRIGFKASEDLGGGLKGLAKFEYRVDTADGVRTADGGVFTARQAWVGLKGGFGQIELGRIKSEYKYAGGVKYDPFVATALQARGNGGMSGGSLGHNSFLTDSLAYRVKAGMVKLGLTYDPSENQGKLSAAAVFGGKTWEGFVALVDAGDGGAVTPGPSYSSTKFGGKIKFGGMHTISGQIELTDNDTGAVNGDEQTFTFIGYQAKMGKNTLAAQIGIFDADGATSVGDVDYFALGIIHKFTKMTRVFGGIRTTSPDTGSAASQDVTVISVGMRKDF